MFAQGFAIKKELINGKSVNEEGIMGEFNKQGARIIEVNDGKAKYTELSPQDIRKLISVRSSPSDLMERLTPLLKHKKHIHHTRRHHRRHHRRHGVARGHTKRHKKRKTHKRKHKRKHKRTKRCKRK
ncbi:MAG: hypothetical protein H8E55_55050 [Pelagibacterales bacterium]|nr:hypothetical protein [Pelagibacterales bacterium]